MKAGITDPDKSYEHILWFKQVTFSCANEAQGRKFRYVLMEWNCSVPLIFTGGLWAAKPAEDLENLEIIFLDVAPEPL